MISVIIPVHNGIKTLDRAVKSVLQQTVREGGSGENLDIILVDDGSDPETASRCDELAAENEGIVRTFHMEDRGVSAARNLGLQEAQGDFITFLDDDDAMEPQMLAVLLDLHWETGCEICGCGFRTVSKEESERPVRIPEQAEESEQQSRFLKQKEESGSAEGKSDPANQTGNKAHIFRGSDIITGRILNRDTRVWSKLFTRKLVGENSFLEGLTIGEDMLFVLTLVRPDTSYAVVETPLYDYTINPKGAMERPFTRSYMDQIRCWEEAERVIRCNFPTILEETDVRAGFGSLQIVSDVLTASKIAKLPETEWNEYGPEFQLCRSKLREHRKIPGAISGSPKDYRVKSLLLTYFPGVYRRLYRRHT